MNEFENDPQSKQSDIVGAIKGFGFSFLFFVLIFVIGAVVNVVSS